MSSKYNLSVITLSDRAFDNIYEDKSGRHIVDYLKGDYEEYNYILMRDNKEELLKTLKEESKKSNLIITTGGTGLASRDITVDVVEYLIDYEVKGITTAIHQLSLSKSYGAMFSRSMAGVYQKTLIICLPGSLKAVTEIVEMLKPHLQHGIDHLNDVSVH